MTEQRKRRLKRQLQESRYRLYMLNEAFAEPLRDMIYVATKDVKRMSTNGSCIYFDPDWLQRLGQTELDFILSHQLMHIALGHIDRPKYYFGDRFHLACDIVANSNLELLGWQYDKLPHIGKIFKKTFFPSKTGHSLTAQEAFDCVPFDPATMDPGVRRNYMIDSESWWDQKEDRGEKGIIILSSDDQEPVDLVLNQATSKEVTFFVKKESFYDQENMDDEAATTGESQDSAASVWDKQALSELQRLRNMTKRNAETKSEEGFVERIWQRANSSNLNWKMLLDSFIQEEVCDYSFTPPDRRLQDSEFFLPDYNVLTDKPKEVLFLVDTSGSVNDGTLSTVYGELCNALTQFDGGLVGVIAFFDTRVYTPMPFSEVRDLLQIIPRGGGGTSFYCVFDYIKKHMALDPPVNIVIFTDGQAEFPNETVADNIPVLWLFSEKHTVPPWGKYAYVETQPNENKNS